LVEGVATLLESGPVVMFGGDVVAGLLRAVYGAASQAVSNADNVRRLLQTAVACAAALARAEQDTLVRPSPWDWIVLGEEGSLIAAHLYGPLGSSMCSRAALASNPAPLMPRALPRI
jgi:hypothetical protein